jgi:Helix-turn-helix domain
MSWQATAYVSELTLTPSGERLTRSEKLVAMMLANRHNPDYGYAWPKVATLAKDALLSVRMVQYCLKSLEKKGVITIERRWKGPCECDTNAYRFPAMAGGGAAVAPGMTSSPADGLHQGGARAVAPKPTRNRHQTDTAAYSECDQCDGMKHQPGSHWCATCRDCHPADCHVS